MHFSYFVNFSFLKKNRIYFLVDEKKDIYENQSQWVCIRFGLHLKRGITLTMVVCDCNNIPWHFVNIMVTRYVEIMCMFRNNFEKSKIFYLRKKLINQSDYITEVVNGTKCRKSDLFALQLLYKICAITSLISIHVFLNGAKGFQQWIFSHTDTVKYFSTPPM